MKNKTVKIIAILIAATLILGLLGPIAYIYVFSEPEDNEAEINELSLKLEKAEQLEAIAVSEYQNRLRSICERGGNSYLDMIFSSQSISELTDNIVIAKELAEYDENLVNTIKSIREEIESDKNEFEMLSGHNA